MPLYCRYCPFWNFAQMCETRNRKPYLNSTFPTSPNSPSPQPFNFTKIPPIHIPNYHNFTPNVPKLGRSTASDVELLLQHGVCQVPALLHHRLAGKKWKHRKGEGGWVHCRGRTGLWNLSLVRAVTHKSLHLLASCLGFGHFGLTCSGSGFRVRVFRGSGFRLSGPLLTVYGLGLELLAASTS